MKMKKIISVLLLALCLVFVVAGCNAKTSKTFTYSVETGDKVDIKLDTTGGYNLTSDLPFTVSQDGTTLSQGTFIFAEQFESYAEAAKIDPKSKVIESSTKDSNQYVFWSYDDSAYNFALLIKDSNTGIIIGNAVSEESARECFNRLTISLVKDWLNGKVAKTRAAPRVYQKEVVEFR